MKRSIVVSSILFIVIVSTVIASIKTTKDIEPITSASVTVGNTRVTLVNIARTVSLSNQYVHGQDGHQGRLYAIPSVYVEFLIERLGNTPIKPDRTTVESNSGKTANKSLKWLRSSAVELEKQNHVNLLKTGMALICLRWIIRTEPS